jgi:hypothetical protein
MLIYMRGAHMTSNVEHGQKARVTAAYFRAYDDPLVMKAGDTLWVQREDEEGPGWWWCVHPDGRSGWVYDTFFRREETRGIALRDYSALELTVEEGEDLTLGEFAGSWYWATNTRGESGWVPATNVELRDAA